jgi:hypothetical protein
VLKKQTAELHEQNAGLADQNDQLRRNNEALKAQNVQLMLRLAQQDAHIERLETRLAQQDADIVYLKDEARKATELHLEAHNIGLLGQLPISVINLAREYVFCDVEDDEQFAAFRRLVRVWNDFSKVQMTDDQRARFDEIATSWQSSWNTPIFIFTNMRLFGSHLSTRSPTDSTPVDASYLNSLADKIIQKPGWSAKQKLIRVKGPVPSAPDLVASAKALADFADLLKTKVGCSELLI